MSEKDTERVRKRRGGKRLQKKDNKPTEDVWQGSLYFIFILLFILKRWVVILVVMRFEKNPYFRFEKKHLL